MAELYRIKRVVVSGMSSTGETKYYENYESFARDLFEFEMQVLYRGDARKHKEVVRLMRIWYDEKIKNEVQGRHTKEVVSVQSLQNGEWVDVRYRVNEPSVAIYLNEDKE